MNLVSSYLHAMHKYALLVAVIFVQQLAAQDTVNTRQCWTGRSAGKLPMLAYGLGEDRLGGAKAGYIDTGIVLKVIDSVADRYLIQLSKYHTAYIAKADVLRDSVFKAKPFYLTGNWRARGGKDIYDTLTLSVDAHLPYKSWMEIDPARIMIDIYGVQSNTNWITQLSSLKEIKNVYFNQAEDDVVHVTIQLQHQQHWGYTIRYDGKRLMVLVKKQPPVLLAQKLKIAIDAGHGGTNVGSEGLHSHVSEKDYTLLFAKAVEKLLKQKKINVVMTRTTDTSFGNTDRLLWLQQQQPDILISLHLNSSDDTSVNGSSTYYKPIGYRSFSQYILKAMLAGGMNEYGNVGNFNFLLNAPTDFPNTLLEIAFLSNPRDEKKILNPLFHKKAAAQIFKGISDWLKSVQ